MEPARIPVADIERQRVVPRIVYDLVDGGRARVPMHDAEGNFEFAEHRLKRPAHGSLLAPDFDADRLTVPFVSAVAAHDGSAEGFGIVPSRRHLNLAGFVHNPRPRDRAGLAGVDKLAANAVGF